MIKAFIPVAGIGVRLRPHTHTQPKPLIPVAGKPILGHIIDNLIAEGIGEFVFVIGHLGEKIEQFVAEKYGSKIKAGFVVQSPRLGLGHALYLSREKFPSSGEILVVLGDTIFDVDLKSVIQSPHSVVGVQNVEDPRSFGVVITNEGGFIDQAVEKPKIPKSNQALVGLYKFREIGEFKKALEALMKQQPSATGEYHLTDAIGIMVSSGVKIGIHPVETWFDCGRKETLLETNRILLGRRNGSTPSNCPGSVIIPPVFISPDAHIENSIIGPFVSIDEHAEVRHSIVRDSIVGAYSSLETIMLDNSVIGADALLRGKANSVNIGDNNEIDFNE